MYIIYYTILFVIEIRATHQGHEQNVKELSKIIDELNEKMEQYHRKIKEKTNFFETC